MQVTPQRRLVVGCGYLGARVAARWRGAGDEVVAVTRSADRARDLETAGLRAFVADVTHPASLARLPDCDTLLFAVGYDRSAGPTLREVYVDGFRATLAALKGRVGRIVYVSTTGVYGDAAGEWVDETTPPLPTREGGIASLAAEELLRASGAGGVALRLAGIYGPGRIPYVERLRVGEPIEAPEQGWLNLIHVDDAATAVMAAADHPAPPAVACVSDGAPPQRGAYYAEVARLAGAPPPRFAAPPAGSPRAARAAADKRVGNALLLGELGVRLAYPSYREGLAAVLGGD